MGRKVTDGTTLNDVYTSVGIDLKELGVRVKMFEILPRD